MELKNKIEKVLKDYGCLQKHKNEGVGEVYNQIRNEDLINDLFALYGVSKSLNADFKIGDAIISRNRKGIILNIYKDNTAHIETYEGENTYRGGANLNDLKHQ